MVAALFALHPINVESVAWAAERKNVLSMLFFLLALHAYGWYARRPGAAPVCDWWLCCLRLACSRKPQVITFPLLLLLWDYWPLRRISRRSALDGRSQRRKRTGLCPECRDRMAGTGKVAAPAALRRERVVTMKAQKAGGAVQALSQYSLPLRMETAADCRMCAIWGRRSGLETGGAVSASHTLYPAWQVGGAGVALAGLITALRSPRARAPLSRCRMVLVSGQPGADDRTGASGRAGHGGSLRLHSVHRLVSDGDLAGGRLGGQRVERNAFAPVACRSRSGLSAGAGDAHLPSGWLLARYPSFWQRTLALTENNYVAHDTLGDFLPARAATEEAAAHFRAALAIRPDDLPANLDLGTYEHGRGNLSGGHRTISRWWPAAR